MSRNGSRRVSFSPDNNEKIEILHKHKHVSRVVGQKIKIVGILHFRLPETSKFSPMRFVRSFSAEVARALRLFTVKRRRSSSKVSSPTMGRSRSYASQVDPHHTEAIEDCIEFINSSSSLQRSNSVCDSSWT
ncbi:hypothetical protein AQUCO_04500007v1 [Aquilegia coerulea]|uniref:Josephin-like protein n=1 Tax=Aquilegia coerulea TaxID=218851 RepID=A0A2G5CLI2_AQUCA|nr:hypothetical protein AQUCO_04500007v1 [Aquilegia coerulea]